MEIEFKKVETEEDIQVMCQVAERVWHLTYDQLLPEGQAGYMIEKFQSPRAVREQREKEGYEYYLICKDGCPGGFIGFSPRYEGREEMFLSKVYLLPELRGQGAVKQAFQMVEEEARRQGLPIIRLTVNKGNTHAAEVYRHYGFEIADSVTTEIGGGYVMDDYIMTKAL